MATQRVGNWATSAGAAPHPAFEGFVYEGSKIAPARSVIYRRVCEQGPHPAFNAARSIFVDTTRYGESVKVVRN